MIDSQDTSGIVISDDLMARCMGRLDLVERVLKAFVCQVGEDICVLQSELSAGNSVEVARIAHRIKGSSANAAIEPIRKHAAAIEEFARADRRYDVADCCEQLLEDWREITGAIASIQQPGDDLT